MKYPNRIIQKENGQAAVSGRVSSTESSIFWFEPGASGQPIFCSISLCSILRYSVGMPEKNPGTIFLTGLAAEIILRNLKIPIQ